MKTIKIAIIAIMGMNLGVNAQQWDSKGDNSTTGNLTLDGNYINLNTPITTGGWARGFFNVGADKVTRIGGVGLLGSKDVPRHYYMAHGRDPWSSGLGIYVKTNGNLGVGTINPSAKLDVNGHIKFDALGSGHTNIQIGHDTNDRIFADNSSNKSYGGGIFFRVTPDPSLNIVHNYIDVMMLTDKGKVGIGTKNTGTHKLAVEGSIGAREIKVEANGWSDFVFYDNYNLPTLKEVENHIKEKGHLKNIPSAKEVEENGIYLGEMDAKLLQKIEELTLYTIEQEKKLKIQEKKIDALEKKNSEIEELKSLVHKLLKDKN